MVKIKSHDYHGYWQSKDNPNLRVCIDKVFQTGHVSGYSYQKISENTFHGQVKKMPIAVLEANYTKE